MVRDMDVDAIRMERDILETLHQSPMKDFFIHMKESFYHGRSYIQVYEYMDIDLYTYMREYAVFQTKDARKLLHQLLLALSQLKECGIVHADLKPENIMINKNLALKVIDFGASHGIEEAIHQPYIVTRYYRAPEIILGAQYNEAIDMWAFGCIAAEMLINRVLYPGDNELEMLTMIKQTHGAFPITLLQSGTLSGDHFDRQGNEYILKVPSSNGIKDVGTTLMTIALISANVRFSAKGLVHRMLLSHVVKRCLELDPAVRLQPADALKSAFFVENQWSDGDFEPGYPMVNGKVLRSPKIPSALP